ncbi:hypothetical protein PHYPO_G00239020 [Pangasianodon hypophthalmus]|uniref:Immunoglobulin V-set domain-containing protein n=1 Tax=Pangasianodon hypophthalmus TaxID=310915 RepID=A0A5N5NCB4_PANHP|nr:hypothetical protein PHYPO_G00239020 [Pangasianodon hypophthalmus]
MKLYTTEPSKTLNMSSRCSAHVWLLVGLACCCLGVCAGDVNVTAFVGESKVLPCSIPVDQTQEMTVRWHRGTKVIYEISAHGHYCSLTYCRPENVSVEEFLKGNCSLVLLNIAMEDAGKYKFHLGNRFYYVNLVVSENPTGGSSSATNSPHKGAEEDGQTWTVRDIAGVVVAVVAVGAVFAAVAVHLKKKEVSSNTPFTELRIEY